MTRFCTAFIRQHLEYAVQIRSSNYIKDQNLLKGVQCQATQQIPTLDNLSCEERLRLLHLSFLHKSKIREDLSEVFKISHHFDQINRERLLDINHVTLTRGNDLELKGRKRNTIARKV